jgi:YHS domain-containing protein
MMRLILYVFDFIFVMVIGWIVSRILRFITGGAPTPTSNPGPFRNSPKREMRGETARDPVCGMFVSTEVSHRLESDGKLLHFCSPECLEKYRSEAAHSQT